MRQRPWLARVITLGVLLVLVGCQFQRNQPPETPWGVLQPRVGGMVLPQATPAQPAMRASSTEARPAAPVLQVGQEVVTVGVDFFRLYADADAKVPVLNVYAAGDSLVVIAPSDAITAYPVIQDGRTWYRVEASDGLVGWVLIDAVIPADIE